MDKFLLIAFLTLITLGFATATDAQAEGALAGTVLDAEGEPIEGAVVTIEQIVNNRRERPFRARAVTNENGVFGWREVPQGRYVVTAAARGHQRNSLRTTVRNDEVTRIRIQLRPLRRGRGGDEREVGSIAGVVIDAEGNRVANARVMLMRVVRNRRGRHIRHIAVNTNERGLFRFEDIPVGRYVLVARARGGGVDRERVAVVAGEETEVELQLVVRERRRGRGDG